jgi:hypothetical protein
MAEIPVSFGGGDAAGRLVDYVALPGAVGRVVSARLATLHELQTIYGLEDLYDLLEIVLVDAHNARVVDEANRPGG